MSKNGLKKKCSKCGKELSLDEFYKRHRTKDGLRCWCKKCDSNYAKKYYKENPEKVRENNKKHKPSKEKTRAYLLKSRHNLTINQYNKILKRQNYKCAICGKHQKEEKRNFAVDHNHQTKRIRGLLCYYCNSQLLKYFRDNKKKIKGFIKYFSKEIREDKLWKE